jgi:hypothetical protein
MDLMNRMRALDFVILLALVVPASASAQAQPAGGTAARTQVVGTVTAVNASANQISLRTDNGDAVTLNAAANIVIVHVAPGVTDPAQAPRMALSEIVEGDRVVANYRGTAGQKSVQATSLVVRTKADLAETARRELEDWRKRGTVGTVSAVDGATQTIMLTVGSRTVTVKASNQTQYRRYSSDSAKPADAKPSSLTEVKPGDQVHVLGNRNEDGTSTTAEVIYAGTFRQLGATVVSVHAETSELQVKDLASKKQITLKVSSDSIMKRLDPQTAATLAKRYAPGRSQNSAAADRGGDVGQILDRLPAITLSEIKAGDALMVSTTMGSDAARATLITLLAGVEPLLTASPTAARDIMSGWSLSTGSDGN